MLAWGLASEHGRDFGPQTLYQFFTNPYYAGTLVDPWDGAEYEGKHTPMVTRAEFARVQQVIRGRNRSVRHQKEHPDFPLRGSLRCDSCLRFMTGCLAKGRSRRYAYYHCRNKSCERRSKSHSAPVLHSAFEVFLDQIAPTSETLYLLRGKIMQELERIGLSHTRR
jgi:site-specific DNA recombinase